MIVTLADQACATTHLPLHCLRGLPLFGHEVQLRFGQLPVPVGNVEVKLDYGNAEHEVLHDEHGQVRDVEGAGHAPALGDRSVEQRDHYWTRLKLNTGLAGYCDINSVRVIHYIYYDTI